MNLGSGAKNWFSGLFTNTVIRLIMSKQYLQFRYERVGGNWIDKEGS